MSSAATALSAITGWNDIGITADRASTAPGFATAGGAGIYMAHVHLAAYNAVNAIHGRFQAYKYPLPVTAGASADAAAIEASYRTPPAAYGCVTGALAETLAGYFGTPNLAISVDSTITGTSHSFGSVREWQKEVEWARIYAGFHYHHSVVQGFVLGHKVAHNLTAKYFRPVR